MRNWIEWKLARLLALVIPDIRSMHYPDLSGQVLKVRLNKSSKFTGSIKLK